MTLPRNVRAIRALYLHQNVLVLELNMQKSLVVNPHTLGREYSRAFIAINMVHELDLLSGDSTELTLTRTESGSELTKIWGFDGFSPKTCALTISTASIPVYRLLVKDRIVTHYAGMNAALRDSIVRLFHVTLLSA